VAGRAVNEHRREPAADPAILHRQCSEVILLAEKVGPALLDRVRRDLWPHGEAELRRPTRR
jgi:hypothetical protein